LQFRLRTAADGSFTGQNGPGVPVLAGSNDLYVTALGSSDVVVHAQLRVESSSAAPYRARSFTLAHGEERELGRWMLGPDSVLVLEGVIEPPYAAIAFDLLLRFEPAVDA
jgi:hypothetical protein